MHWQPIETVPKDGRPVDLWLVCGNLSKRETDCYPATSKDYPDAWVKGFAGRFVTGRSYIDEEGDNCYDPSPHHEKAWKPTHWIRVTPPEGS